MWWGMLVLLLLAGAGRAKAALPDAQAPSPPGVDSLLRELRRPSVPDTVRVRYYARLCRLLRNTDLNAAQRYGQRALDIARSIRFPAGEALALNNLAAAQYGASELVAAQENYEAQLRLARREAFCPLVGNALLGLGNVASSMGNVPRALQHYQEARAAYAGCSPPNVAGELLVLRNLATNYLTLNKVREAHQALRQALALVGPETSPGVRVGMLNLLGELQAEEGHTDSAATTWKNAAGLARTHQNGLGEATALAHLAEDALGRRRPEAARQYIQRALRLTRQVGDQQLEESGLHVLALALRELRRPEAFDTLVRYQALHDTLMSQGRTDAIAEAQARFDLTGQQARIRELEQRRRIDDLMDERRVVRTRLLGLGGLVLALALGGWLAWSYRRRQAATEAALRQRLAADLHDDVGSLLTQISWESSLLQDNAHVPDPLRPRLQHLAEASRRATQHMSDVVWGLGSTNDGLDRVLERMRDHAYEALAPTGVDIDFQMDETLPELALPQLTSHNLYLIFKEALHNVVKHAQATLVTVQLHKAGGELVLRVHDDGQGHNGPGRAGGAGLRNMQARAEAVGGQVRYENTEPGFAVVARLPC